MKQDNLQ